MRHASTRLSLYSLSLSPLSSSSSSSSFLSARSNLSSLSSLPLSSSSVVCTHPVYSSVVCRHKHAATKEIKKKTKATTTTTTSKTNKTTKPANETLSSSPSSSSSSSTTKTIFPIPTNEMLINGIAEADAVTPNLQILRIIIFMLKRSREDAVTLCTQFIEEAETKKEIDNKLKATVHSLRAMNYQSLHQPAKSLIDIEKALDYSPHDIQFVSLKGHVLMTMRRFSEALECFDKAIEMSTSKEDTAELWYAIANVQLQKDINACGEALSKIEELVKPLSNLHLYSQHLRALYYRQKKETDKAMECIDYAKVRLLRATAFFIPQRRFNEGLEDLDTIISHNKERYEPFIITTVVKTVNDKWGISDFFKISDKPVPVQNVTMAVYNKTMSYYKKMFKTEMKTTRNSMEIFLWKAMKGDLQIAEEGLTALLHDGYTDAHCFALAQLHIHLGKYEEAIEDFELMFANDETDLNDPQIASVLLQTAFCAIKLQKKGIAVRALDDVPNLQPGANETPYWKELYSQANRLKPDEE